MKQLTLFLCNLSDHHESRRCHCRIRKRHEFTKRLLDCNLIDFDYCVPSWLFSHFDLILYNIVWFTGSKLLGSWMGSRYVMNQLANNLKLHQTLDFVFRWIHLSWAWSEHVCRFKTSRISHSFFLKCQTFHKFSDIFIINCTT